MASTIRSTHQVPTSEAAPLASTDFAEHQHTYNAFIKGVKWAIGILVVVIIALYFIIRP